MAKNAILVKGLTKHFGAIEALRGIDFEVPVGTVFGLLGPNGAGKTTAVRVLATVLRPDGGRAEVMGIDVAKNPAEVRFRIGLAGQSAAVDPNLTGRENLVLIGRLSQMRSSDIRPRAAELLERFELADAADRTARTYSGGMRRRLDVAAALVARPQVLFLDEPTTGLDITSRSELWAVIKELVNDGHTVLLTTQYLEEADRLADRVAVIDHGQVVANDTPEALKNRLGRTVIELELKSERIAKRVPGLLSSMRGVKAEQEGVSVRVTSAQGAKLIVEMMRILDANRVVPTGLTVREPSLDDVFLALTGHRAEEDGSG